MTFRILKGPNRLKSSFREGRVVAMFFRFNHTKSPTWNEGAGFALRSNFLLYVACEPSSVVRNSLCIVSRWLTRDSAAGFSYMLGFVRMFKEARGWYPKLA